MCGDVLPLSQFNDARVVCKEDDAAGESLQRGLRKRWGKAYKAIMVQVKKDPERWPRSVVAYRVANKNNNKRVLGGGKDRLAQVKVKAKRRRSVRATRKMCYHQFSIYYSSAEHGAYPASLLRPKWDALIQGQEKVDDHGVVAGVSGHPRYRIPLEDVDDSVSESESGHERIHEHSTAAKADMDLDDIHQFLIGDLDLQMLGDVELPPELLGFTPEVKAKAKAKGKGKAQVQNAPQPSDLDGEPDDEDKLITQQIMS